MNKVMEHETCIKTINDRLLSDKEKEHISIAAKLIHDCAAGTGISIDEIIKLIISISDNA